MNFVYKTFPRPMQESIGIDAVLEAYFMVDMDKNSFGPNSVILINLTSQAVEPVTFEYKSRLLSIKPLNKMLPNTHYQVQILGGSDGIKDITKREMPDSYEFEFYTKDNDNIKPPVIISPVDVSAVQGLVEFQLQAAVGADYYEMEISRSNTFNNIVWPTDGQVFNTLTVTPQVAYEVGLYYMRIRSVIATGEKSAWSESIRFFSESGVTINEPQEATLPDDPVTPITLVSMSRAQETSQLQTLQNLFGTQNVTALADLEVLTSSPAADSVNNTIKQITIEFSEDIDATTLTKDTCYVLSERN